MTSTVASRAGSPDQVIELSIGGMTCASCAARIGKNLGKLDGVVATVNVATLTARVTVAGAVSPQDLVAAVEEAGYSAAPLSQPGLSGAEPSEALAEPDEPAAQTRRLWVCLALSVPVVVAAMVPAARFPDWQWASLALATPVAACGAWPFHRAALINARHGAATMDTLMRPT